MIKYINANDIYDGMRKHGFEAKYITRGEFVDHLPSADVVEVVRCKDCVHFHISQPIQGKEITECTREGYEYDAASVKPDDFCSYGERRESKW